MCCPSSCFSFVGVRLVKLSLRCTATFVICFHLSLLLQFSLNMSSSSAFLRSLYTQSCHISCGLVFCNLLASLSKILYLVFHSDHYPANFIRLLNMLPTVLDLLPTSSLRYFILIHTTLYTLVILLIQLFSHTCSLCCFSSSRANVSKPYTLQDNNIIVIATQPTRWLCRNYK